MDTIYVLSIIFNVPVTLFLIVLTLGLFTRIIDFIDR